MCNYIISAAISNFGLPVSSGSVTGSPIGKFDPQNIGVAVGIALLATLEIKIHQGDYLTPPLQHKRQQNSLQRDGYKNYRR